MTILCVTGVCLRVVQRACAGAFDVFYPDLSRKWVWPVADTVQ